MTKGNPNDESLRESVQINIYDDNAQKLKPLYIAPDATDQIRGDVYLTDTINNELDATTGVTAITPKAVSDTAIADLVKDAKLAAQAAQEAAQAAKDISDTIGSTVKAEVAAFMKDLIIDIEHGGTSANNIEQARTNLGLGTIATLNTPLAIEYGGTNAITAPAARANLGLGTIATLNSPLPVTNGGTGANIAKAAIHNLGGIYAGGALDYVAVGADLNTAPYINFGQWSKNANNTTIKNGPAGVEGEWWMLYCLQAYGDGNARFQVIITLKSRMFIRHITSAGDPGIWGGWNEFYNSVSSPAVPITKGGTGATAVAAALNNLEITPITNAEIDAMFV